MISVIIPSYNEEKIEENISEVAAVLEKNGILYEIIIIDDGSDRNIKYDNILKKEKNIRIIYLSRNFGKESALCAGLDNAAGDCAVCMDADLQHPPELIPQMYSLYKKCGYDIVEGAKSDLGKRNAGYAFLSGIFYRLIKILTGKDINRNSDFRLIGKKPLSSIREMKECNLFFREITDWVGFSRVRIYFDTQERTGGTSKWTPKKLFSLAVSAITLYTSFPLYIPLITSIIFLFTALFSGIFNIISEHHSYTPLLFFLSSVLLLCTGITAIYTEKIYREVLRRPRYIIKEIKGNAEK
ncbi:MAG: glycosyltransferase family 2 protein [Oscillospiraceae bacterium]|nr:glycosyltransferase family 2 protein [Oscillospiraceae bacterium]